jgi:hypothetical protein
MTLRGISERDFGYLPPLVKIRTMLTKNLLACSLSHLQPLPAQLIYLEVPVFVESCTHSARIKRAKKMDIVFPVCDGQGFRIRFEELTATANLLQ